jgi:hypothetical protein
MNDKEQPAINQSASTMKDRRTLKIQGKRTRLLLALFALVIVVVAAWLLARNPNSTDYKYDKLDTYKLPGFLKGAGMEFKKPVEVQPVAPTTDGLQAMTLVHDKVLPNTHTVTLSYVAAASSFNTMYLTRTQSDYNNANSGLTDPSNKLATYYRGEITHFINQNINRRWKITLGQGRGINTANLQHAWEIDFTGVDSNPKASYVPTKLKGQVIFSIGKGAWYYFMESGVNGNFDKNKDVWQQVTDSLKIDQ